MQFFKRILQPPEAGVRPVARAERRGTQRLALSPEFPLKAALTFTYGDAGRQSSDWKGPLLNLSAVGARIQLGPGALAERGDYCELRLSLGGFKLVVPCHITNVRVERDGIHFGLKHDIGNAATQGAYQQLLEIIAFGATLKLKSRTTKPDESGYLVEQYASDWQSRLRVWRDQADQSVTAFEFQLKDCVVRAARGQRAEYLSGADAASVRRAPPARAEEIQRLFQWVVPNLAPAVAADVRAFLQSYTA